MNSGALLASAFFQVRSTDKEPTDFVIQSEAVSAFNSCALSNADCHPSIVMTLHRISEQRYDIPIMDLNKKRQNRYIDRIEFVITAQNDYVKTFDSVVPAMDDYNGLLVAGAEWVSLHTVVHTKASWGIFCIGDNQIPV